MLATTALVVLSGSSIYAQKSLDVLLEQYNTRSVPYISVEGLRALQMHQNIVILDAREIEEYQVSKLEGARFVGYNQFSAEKISEEIPEKDTPIIVYCSLGIRSEEIGEKLQEQGFTNIKNLYGGIFEWKNKGYPVLNWVAKETDSVHAFSKSWSKWLTKGIPVYNVKHQ
ncbi:MAG: rhodanese-like domain-containing protein [Marinirhabdus sp.]|nr:rhodanese-like domain-containing protein [Marinirhabdus sp.]